MPWTLNPLVVGSIPTRPTNTLKGLARKCWALVIFRSRASGRHRVRAGKPAIAKGREFPMRNVGFEGRSFQRITPDDLRRLAHIAAADRAEFFGRHQAWAKLYESRFIAAALCQGAALHYLYRKVGVQDFDVYSFYAAHPKRHWYAKRNKHCDFGLPEVWLHSRPP